MRILLCWKSSFTLFWNQTPRLAFFSVGVEEVRGEREGSRSGDSDISGAFGATYHRRISQLPWHFLKRATHYQAEEIPGTFEDIFHREIMEEPQKVHEPFRSFRT